MYLPNQVVHNLDTNEPFKMSGNVWEISQYPKRHTHYVKRSAKTTPERAPGGLFYELFEIALPKDVEEARLLLSRNLIAPAPCLPTHCWRCGNWLSNHNADGSCWEK